MSTMTTTMRGTPNLSVAPTQNTAPVHEFRCMFSHDLRKKKKTWHDGSLRFHTFNRRVMVYDDIKNFIGDLHYRVVEEFGEGTELQLDKGVLVQVEDRIGQTETDLAPLLDKRRPEDRAHGPPGQSESQIPSIHRLSLPYTQGRLKSLADVLGASQGPIGRARLPTRSPYEKRNNTPMPPPVDGRPAKRQRVAAGKENALEDLETVLASQTARTQSHNLERCDRHKSPLIEQRRVSEPRGKEVVAISSDDEPPRSKAPPARSKTEAASSKTKSNVPTKNKTRPTRDLSPRSKPTARPVKSRKEREAVEKALLSTPQDTPRLNASVDGVRPWTRTSLSGKTRLCLATGKSRPKLMYRALLPSSAGLTGVTMQQSTDRRFELEGQPSKSVNNSRSASDAQAEKTKDASNIFDIDDIGELEVDVQAHSRNLSNMTPVRVQDQSSSVLSSPLFCSDSLRRADDELPDPSQDDLIIPSSMQEQVILSPYPPAVCHGANRNTKTPDQRDQVTSKWPTESEKLALLDRRFLGPLPPPVKELPERLQESPKPRTFRRILSEGDSVSENDAHHEPSTNIPAALESMKAKLRRAPKSQQAHRSPTKPQQLVSDMSGLVSPTRVVVEPPEVDAVHESGPWTTVEAYMLFDWWPPSRQKPTLSDRGQRQTGDQNVAQGVLRDEANVL